MLPGWKRLGLEMDFEGFPGPKLPVDGEIERIHSLNARRSDIAQKPLLLVVISTR